MSLESAIRKAIPLWYYFFFKRLLTYMIWILAQIRITPSEEGGCGEGGHIFLPKLGLWEGVVFLNDLLMSVCNTKN